ncbi:hypothetical protein KSP39_PZI014476 [Platanthera zijinensis]|uniref:Uncharacterized protein n=1 Tax=Platanthera zijinensis TaxID=2320716 RepID=A0AAP0BAL2_9ASPA
MAAASLILASAASPSSPEGMPRAREPLSINYLLRFITSFSFPFHRERFQIRPASRGLEEAFKAGSAWWGLSCKGALQDINDGEPKQEGGHGDSGDPEPAETVGQTTTRD